MKLIGDVEEVAQNSSRPYRSLCEQCWWLESGAHLLNTEKEIGGRRPLCVIQGGDKGSPTSWHVCDHTFFPSIPSSSCLHRSNRTHKSSDKWHLGPFSHGAGPFNGLHLLSGDHSTDTHWAGKWQVCLHSLSRVETERVPLSFRWRSDKNRLSVCFHPIRHTYGK